MPSKPASPAGSTQPVDGDESWPIGVDGLGRLKVIGRFRSYVGAVGGYRWESDFDYCSAYGRRSGPGRVS